MCLVLLLIIYNILYKNFILISEWWLSSVYTLRLLTDRSTAVIFIVNYNLV